MSGYNFQKNIVFYCLEIFLTFTNSVDPDEMQYHATFHLDLHCLQKYSFRGFPNTNLKGLMSSLTSVDCYDGDIEPW